MANTPVINPTSLKGLQDLDPIFGLIIETYGVPPLWSRSTGFETLSRIILEQQVSLMSAKASYEKLSGLLTSFEPQHILLLTDDEMRTATISRQKSSYIKGLAQMIVDDDINLDQLSNMNTSEAHEQLVSIRGIGNWTSEVYLLFCLQAPDIFPRGDVALNNTVKELKPSITTKEEIYEYAEKWSPFRSTAAFLLWHYYLRKRNRAFVI